MRLATALLAACGLLACLPALAQSQGRLGREVYETVCIACHASENVMVSSPKLGDRKEWQERMARAGGLDGLVRNAMRGWARCRPAAAGKNSMPTSSRPRSAT